MRRFSVVRLDRDGPEGTASTFRGHPEAESVIESGPTETGHNDFNLSTGQLTAGVRECTPCTSRIDSYPVDEFCTILGGTAASTDDEGHAETFRLGGSFAIPGRLKGAWSMPGTTREFHVIFDAKPVEA